MLQCPKILFLSGEDAEAGVLEEILSERAILTCARNLRQLKVLLEQGEYDALLCSWFFDLGTWKNALEEVQQRDPDLPVIVLSRTAGEPELVAVLEAGAFDLLVPPYRQQALLAGLEQASASRWRLRDLGTVSKKKAV